MRNHLAIAGLYLLLGAGLALGAFGLFPSIIEGLQGESEAGFRLVQILVPAAVAFAGFYFGTLYKYRCDLKLAETTAAHKRRLLATELLAELRHVHEDIQRLRRVKEGTIDHPARATDDDFAHFLECFVLPDTPVYHSSVGKLGLLGANEARQTIAVFSRFATINRDAKSAIRTNPDDRSLKIAAAQIVVHGAIRWVTPLIPDLDRALAEIAQVEPMEFEEEPEAAAVY